MHVLLLSYSAGVVHFQALPLGNCGLDSFIYGSAQNPEQTRKKREKKCEKIKKKREDGAEDGVLLPLLVFFRLRRPQARQGLYLMFIFGFLNRCNRGVKLATYAHRKRKIVF